MMKEELFKLFFKKELSTREAVYEFIAWSEQNENLSRTAIQTKLVEREELGDIQISKGVLLPHFESDDLKESSISIIWPTVPIVGWEGVEDDIKLIIVLSFSPHDPEHIKKQIMSFFGNLADSDFVEKLLSAKNEKDVEKLLV